MEIKRNHNSIVLFMGYGPIFFRMDWGGFKEIGPFKVSPVQFEAKKKAHFPFFVSIIQVSIVAITPNIPKLILFCQIELLTTLSIN